MHLCDEMLAHVIVLGILITLHFVCMELNMSHCLDSGSPSMDMQLVFHFDVWLTVLVNTLTD